MRKHLLYLALSVVVAFSSTCVWAGAKNTPLEAFIYREQEQNSFVPVSGMWETSASFPVSATDPYVSGAAVLDLDMVQLAKLMREKTQGITLTVPNPKGGFYELELARFDFLSKDFQIQENGTNGTKKMADYTPGVYYRGIVKGVEGSLAVFSFFNENVYGVFSMPNGGNMVLVPNTLAGAAADNYLLYNDLDLKIKPKGDCGTDRLPSTKDMKRAANKNVYSTCKDLEVFFKADFETFNSFGQSTTALANYMTSLFNVTSTLYRNEGIYVSIKFMEVNTAMDNYQFLSPSSSDYLMEFTDDMMINQPNLHDADMAMLLSTMHGSTLGGVAFLDQLCFGTPLSFANIDGTVNTFPTYSWDGHMVTHELGHTIGSPHTHSCSWNSTGTAIDACVPVQGACGNPTPAIPSGGGTIMSYCHFVSAGVNFTKGFGTQPGNLIRDKVFSAPCAEIRLVTQPTNSKAKTITANRECTDDIGVTYYWNDNNNTDEEDDVLALKIRKANANIGTLDDIGMSVKSSTSFNYSNGSGVNVTMPAGSPIPGGTNVGNNRYWKVTPTAQPAGEVEVIFPMMVQDITDIKGSVPNSTSLNAANMMMYIVTNTAIDPNPAAGLPNATPADISTYTNASSASTSNWSIETIGDTILAHFNVKKLVGGAVFYSYSQDPQSVQNIFEEGTATFFPNPTNNNWNVYVPNSGNNIMLNLYTVDGRTIATQQLKGGVLNEVKATQLPAGLYYYRISSETATFTGTLQKK